MTDIEFGDLVCFEAGDMAASTAETLGLIDDFDLLVYGVYLGRGREMTDPRGGKLRWDGVWSHGQCVEVLVNDRFGTRLRKVR